MKKKYLKSVEKIPATLHSTAAKEVARKSNFY